MMGRARVSVAESNAETTWQYFVSSWVTPLRTNRASAWANHADGLDLQNVGNLTDTASTIIDYNRVVICRGSPMQLNCIMYIIRSPHLPIIHTHNKELIL